MDEPIVNDRPLTRRAWTAWALASVAAMEGCGGSGTTSGIAPSPPAAQCQTTAAKRVLFVGNSQIAVNDVPRIVSSLAASRADGCGRITSSSIAVGSANLRSLWQDGRALAAIQSGQIDAVVLAESIDLVFPEDAGYPADFRVYANLFIDAAKAAGVQPILYATPNIDTPQRVAQFQGMADPQLALGRERGVQVATGGLAWLRAWQIQPTLNLHDTDRQHANYLGSTLSALVLYATLTGLNPLGLTAMPQTDCSPNCPVISSDLALMFQQVAWAEYQANGRLA